MTGLCIILIDAVVARQETQKKGHTACKQVAIIGRSVGV